MDFSAILETYALFFSWEEIVRELGNPANWGIILSLIVIEGLLSADNALVLAAIVKKLPEKQRKKALTYGIWGAYLFRFIAIGLGVYLVQFDAVKIFGGGYLVWMALKFFYDQHKAKQEDEETTVKEMGLIYRIFGLFWGTIIVVEMMDIAFSIDSVLAAFAISEQVWVLLLGGMLGILMMRKIAIVFLKLLDKIPELETSAFVIILFIGLKMVLSVFGITLPGGETMQQVIFFGVLISILGGTFVLHHFKNKKGIK